MAFNDEQKNLVKKLALKNALKHEGKANPKALIGGFLGEYPDSRKDMKNVMLFINEIVSEINNLSLDEQKKKLLELSPKEFEKKERNLFEFLNIKDGERVKTAFPPGAEKQPHIGHAKAMLVNYLLAKQYGGEFCLRFEDTNPDLVKAEFYEIMKQDFEWLGIGWDELVYASDHMDLYNKHCEDLLKKGEAYACTCKGEEIKKQRETGTPCECRSQSKEKNLEMWREMQTSMEPGTATIRLKIDLLHKNSTMRDPSIFRINTTEHARHKNKYRAWPTYDFQNSIMDGYFKITHRIRSKEFEMRNELQRYIQRLLGYEETNIYEFGRFNIEGVEASGRKIRELIQQGKIIGWDDPTLTTIAALRRRGFLPKAIENFVIRTGITKNDATMTWDDLIMQNKRLLDDEADRYYFVANPIKIKIEGAPSKEFELSLHPTHRKKGRKFKTNNCFFVSKKDYDSLKKNEIYRLIELFNFKFGDSMSYVDEEIKTFKEKGKGMIHYLPCEENVEAEVMMPDKEIIKGLCEKNIENVKIGEVVQFERFGFCRLDKIENNKYYFWYTH